MFFFNTCQLEKENDRLVKLTDTTKMENTKIELQLVKEIEEISGSEIIWNEENGDWILCGNGQLFWGNGKSLLSQSNFPNYYRGKGDFDFTDGVYSTFDRQVSTEEGKINVQQLDRKQIDAVTEEEMMMNYFFENAYASNFIRRTSDKRSLVSYEHRGSTGFDEDLYQGDDNLLVLESEEPIERTVLEGFPETMEITGLGISEHYYFAANQTLHIWDKDLNKINHQLAPNYSSKIVDILTKEGQVFLFRANGSLEIISEESWELENSMQILDSRPYSLAYYPKQALLIGGCQDKTLYFYKWKGSSFELMSKQIFDLPILTAKLEPSGQFLYLAHPQKLSIYKFSMSEK